MVVFKEFRCSSCGHQQEHLVDNLAATHPCQGCGKEASRVHTSFNFQLEGTSGDYPTAAAKWAKNHEA
jgi:putative FmdB family regulatory protein